MKRQHKIIATFIACVIVLGPLASLIYIKTHDHSSHLKTIPRLQRLRPGMTIKDVDAALGEADQTYEVGFQATCKVYKGDNGKKINVVFDKNGVIDRVNEDENKLKLPI